MKTLPSPIPFLLLMLLAVVMHPVAARVTINMEAAEAQLQQQAAQTTAVPAAAATSVVGTVATTAAPSAASVQQAATATTNSMQKALAQLLSPNGTHKINITLPKLPGLQPRNVSVPKVLQQATNFSFNITLPKLLNFSSVGAKGSNATAIKKDTLNMATDVLQQLAQLQPSLAKLQTIFKDLNVAGTTSSSRSLLEEDVNYEAAEDVNVEDVEGDTSSDAAVSRALLADDSIVSATGNSDGETKNATEVLNSRKIAQKVNLAMSDGWLVLYSGFKVAQASVQLLAALLRAGTTGVVSVDPALLLTFADLGTNFSSAVSYLMYGLEKTVADVVTPFGIFKPTKN
jgi:hypothetical protein